jgi:hypothetical protein
VTTSAKWPVILPCYGASCVVPVLAGVIPGFKWRTCPSPGFVGVPQWREARWLVRVLVAEPEVGPGGLELLVEGAVVGPTQAISGRENRQARSGGNGEQGRAEQLVERQELGRVHPGPVSRTAGC